MGAIRSFDEYSQSYQHVRFARSDDGIVEVTLHTDGGPLVWTGITHRECEDAFEEIANDRDNRVVILTGAGDTFCVEWTLASNHAEEAAKPLFMDKGMFWGGRRLHRNLAAIEVPIVAAVNGPAHLHGEIPAICDVVIAADTASFQDPHFIEGAVPGDGAHIIWPMVMGLNRARYFLLMGQVLSAKEALDMGVVNEVVPAADVMTRARAVAAQLAKAPTIVLRYSRIALLNAYKQQLEPALGYGLLLEQVAMRENPPQGL